MKIHQRSGWSSEVEIPEIQKKPRNPNRIIVFNLMFDLELNNQVRNGNWQKNSYAKRRQKYNTIA